MTEHAGVVVIGGGIMGCSALYQLARLGWHDALLLEKDELTSGCTWHAAGQLILSEASVAITRINLLSRAIYDSLEAATGQPIGLHRTGRMELATSRQKLRTLRRAAVRAAALGIDYRVLSPRKVAALCPVMDIEGILGAGYSPDEGHLDPAQATQAFASGARAAGARIRRHVRVTGLAQRGSGEWQISTGDGDVVAGQVVIAGGFWSPALARLAGVDLPIVTVERQYLVTEPVPEVAARATRLPLVSDHDVPFYFRQEGDGLMFGVYEDRTPFCFTDGIPEDFAHELLPADLERGERYLAAGMRRVPALARVGIRRVVCGPTSRTPDFHGLLGPLAGCHGLWTLAGFSAGISQGAAAGRLLAEWMVEGEPSLDVAPLDVNRFGDHATPDYVRQSVAAVRGYGAAVPDGESGAGRPARIGPLHAIESARGAHFGARDGFERALWYARHEAECTDGTTLRRAVRRECADMCRGAGLLDLTGTAVFEIRGPDAATALDALVERPLAGPGRSNRDVARGPRGGIAAAFEIAHLADGTIWLRAPARARHHHWQWLDSRLRGTADVSVEDRTDATAILRLTGPAAAGIVEALAGPVDGREVPVSGEAGRLRIGFARAIAVADRWGDLPVIDLLVPVAAAAPLGGALRHASLRPVGLLALESARVAAGIPEWGPDLGPTVHPGAIGIGPRSPERLCRLTVAGGDRPPQVGDLLAVDGAVVAFAGSSAHARPGDRGRWTLLAVLPERFAVPGTRLRLLAPDADRRAEVLGTAGLA